jgi:hypothetical protein
MGGIAGKYSENIYIPHPGADIHSLLYSNLKFNSLGAGSTINTLILTKYARKQSEQFFFENS